jgi:hypothetical protein
MGHGNIPTQCRRRLIDAEGRSCIYAPITHDGKAFDSQVGF